MILLTILIQNLQLEDVHDFQNPTKIKGNVRMKYTKKWLKQRLKIIDRDRKD